MVPCWRKGNYFKGQQKMMDGFVPLMVICFLRIDKRALFWQININFDGFVKSHSVRRGGLRLIFHNCGVLICTPHSSRFARLA